MTHAQRRKPWGDCWIFVTAYPIYSPPTCPHRLCAGQDNMAFTVEMSLGGDKESRDAAQDPYLRLYALAPHLSPHPLLDPALPPLLPWSRASQAAVTGPPWSYFSAVCFFFGRERYRLREV